MRKQLLSLLCTFTLVCSAVASPKVYTPKPIDPAQIVHFTLAFSQIKQFYVSEKTDKQLFEDALTGMLKGLDPHSTYFNEQDLKEFKNQTSGDFVGIGVEISEDKGLIKVVTPLDGSPAKKAGLETGDYIVAVNGKPVIGMPMKDVVKLIRGKPGTTVSITVSNQQNKKTRTLKITRAKIKMQSVKSEMLEDGFGYVRVAAFQETTAKKFRAAVKQLIKQSHDHLKGLIIDLRNNPGGLLTSAVDIVDSVLDSRSLGKNKKIIYTKGRVKEASSEFNASPGDLLKGKPIIVLVNEGSASGSEVVAGALQDHKRAVVLGKQSFGKGSVQTLMPIDEKTAVKITTALYYTPKGRSIQAKGIQPDIIIEKLKVSKDDEEALFFKQLKEKHLNGHLQNGDKAQENKHNADKQIKRAQKDYQLHEALVALKALSVVNHQVGVTS